MLRSKVESLSDRQQFVAVRTVDLGTVVGNLEDPVAIGRAGVVTTGAVENCFPSLLDRSLLATCADGSAVLGLGHHILVGAERVKVCWRYKGLCTIEW